MQRIHRHLVATRAPQHFSSVCPQRHPPSLLSYSNVSFQRLFANRHRRVLRWIVRPFSQTLYVAAAGQTAQPNERVEHDDDDDDDSVTHVLQKPENTSKHEIEHSGLGQSSSPQWQSAGAPFDSEPPITRQDDNSSQNHASEPPNPYDEELPLDEDDFAALDGFWPLGADGLTTAASSNAAQISGRQDNSNERDDHKRVTSDELTFTGEEWRNLWRSPIRTNKIDLSYWKPSVGERKGTYFAQPKIIEDRRTPIFRASRGPRKLVAHFLDKFYHHVSPTEGLSDETAIALLEDPVFGPLKNDINLVVDILNWSWVVVAHPGQRFKRLTSLLHNAQGESLTKLPQWLALQILRSERIETPDFVNLLDIIVTKSGEWSTEASLMILTVRLVRHARLTSPLSLYSVVEYFIQLLGQHYSSNSTIPELQDRAHMCNRLLRLLSIPTHSNPFMHVRIQQDAQLLLLHHMYDASPPVPLNREGYRALVMLQLMHEKTDMERAWARRQADTWPPWEKQHQMGVTAQPRQSSGSTSRANTVLLRMREDGYSPYSFDIAAQIIGGRDSDGSPTIQVRRKPSVLNISSPWLPDTGKERLHIASHIWAARITATRTVREAWMGFCAYETTCDESKQTGDVYLAMFQKLWAETISAQPERDLLPGDGLENFPDPDLVRDRVHVPEDPPSPDEFYARMRANGIRPAGRLLNQLLGQERYLSRGLAYIRDSTLPPQLKEILANPTIHTPDELAKQLRNIPPALIKEYIGLLARLHFPRRQEKPAYKAVHPKVEFLGPQYALQVLRLGKLSEPTILTKYIAGLSVHVRDSDKDGRKLHIPAVWGYICSSFALKVPAIDCSALPHVLYVAWRLQTAPGWSISSVMDDPLEVAKRFFMAAVLGTKVTGDEGAEQEWNCCMPGTYKWLRSVPTADMVQELAFVMLAAQRSTMAEDVLNLLRWMSKHRAQITSISSITKRNLAAFRTYLEGQWAIPDPKLPEQELEIVSANESQIEEAKEICEQLGGWAHDAEVQRYLKSSGSMFARLKRKLKKASSA